MIMVSKATKANGVLLKGDFFDLDRLYFAIMKFTGFHGMDEQCVFSGRERICENLLGLCYEMRHAWQGNRDIEQMYNGIQDEWFDDYSDYRNPPEALIEDSYDFEIDDENEEEEACVENDYRFSRKDFPDAKRNNTYFSISMPFPEAVFYALILSDLLEEKALFFAKREYMAKKTDPNSELNKEYLYFQAEEDIARITIFVNQTLHALYRFIGEEKYMCLMHHFKQTKKFSLHCDLDKLNEVISGYGEKEYVQDDPENLFQVVLSFFDS